MRCGLARAAQPARREVHLPAADARQSLGRVEQLSLELEVRDRLVQPEDRAAKLQLRDHGSCEDLEGVRLLLGELTPLVVDDAQRAEAIALGRDERSAGVEADVRLADDQRVVGEARILGGVLDDEGRVGEDGVGAEGLIARRFAPNRARSRP